LGKHYGHIIIDKVVELQEKGLTLREIGEKIGYENGKYMTY
jgi:YesN/AraC family two-component response regulator